MLALEESMPEAVDTVSSRNMDLLETNVRKPGMLEHLKFKVLNIYTRITSKHNLLKPPQNKTYALRITDELRTPSNTDLSLQSDKDDPYLEYLARRFPTGDFENWTECQRLLAHANIAYNSVPVTPKSWEAWAQIVTNVAWYLWKQGDYDIACKMITEALIVRERVLGLNDARTLVSVEILAGVLSSQGNHIEAVASNRRALKGFKKSLGSLHPFTLTCTSNLALSLQHLGRFKESERLSRLALSGSKILMGSCHVDTLTRISNLALVLQHQGKYKQAMKLNLQSLNGFHGMLGKYHPSTLTSMSNLAIFLQYQGRYEESEALQWQCLEGKIEELGRYHPSTLMSVGTLVSVLQCQGKWKDLEQFCQRYEEVRV